MLFLKHNPSQDLAHLVKEFWIFENADPTPGIQKVIPDGYCEIIIHYGDPFRIKLYDSWELQEQLLFSGQIRHFFHLENTGIASMLGIKLMPDAPARMLNLHMENLTDRVIPLHTIYEGSAGFDQIVNASEWDERVSLAEAWIRSLVDTEEKSSRISLAVLRIMKENGMSDIEAVAASQSMTRRHLEREFKKVVGLTPKYFARIVQFSYIFEAMQRQDNAWVDVALNSGYFDQSHFIRNFKAFTGESPSRYGFDEKNLANFFLRK